MIRRRRERGGEIREDKTFEDFRGWAEERNWTVRGGEERVFTRFRHGNDMSFFPD